MPGGVRTTGDTWSSRVATGIPGIETRPGCASWADGALLVGSHYMFRATRKKGESVSRSSDGGKSWQRLSVVASDRVHHFVEGALLPLRSGRLVCVMRESKSQQLPVLSGVFSDDCRKQFGRIRTRLPFSGDRPFPGQLGDGRVLVTHRNQGGIPGLYAWIGDIEAEAGYQVSLSAGGPAHRVSRAASGPEGAPRAHLDELAEHVTLTGGALVIANERIDGIRLPPVFPPESSYSDVSFRGVLRATGEQGVFLRQDQAGQDRRPTCSSEPDRPQPETAAGAIDQSCNIDMTRWRDLGVDYRDGKIEISVDGASVIRNLVFQETMLERSYFRQAIRSTGGTLSLRSVRYRVENPGDHDHRYEWHAASNQYPQSVRKSIAGWSWTTTPTPTPITATRAGCSCPMGGYSLPITPTRISPPGKACLKGYYLRPEELSRGG